MNTKNYDAVIVGGGAAGLMCAVSAKNKNKNQSVAIIEKNDRVGKKLLSTGNGRCNLTNEHISVDRYRGSFCAQAESLFEKYTTEHLLRIFEALGLLTYRDSEGRYYPLCNKASAVLDVLRFACERLGVDVYCSQRIKSMSKKGDIFKIITESVCFNSDKLVLACGSKSSPKLGGSASGIDYLRNFGISCAPFSPALCPIMVNSPVLKSLKGLRAQAAVSLINKDGMVFKTDCGEVQFTEDALSGICVFNLSLYNDGGGEISLKLLPDYSYKELTELLFKQKELFSEHSIDEIFTGILQKRIGQAVLKVSGISDFSRLCKSLNESEISKLCNTLKGMRFKIISNDDFSRSQASLGGALGDEIDEKTMQSKKVNGLYVCGEAVDICGECGGYNLHFAFSSGHLAGESL